MCCLLVVLTLCVLEGNATYYSNESKLNYTDIHTGSYVSKAHLTDTDTLQYIDSEACRLTVLRIGS